MTRHLKITLNLGLFDVMYNYCFEVGYIVIVLYRKHYITISILYLISMPEYANKQKNEQGLGKCFSRCPFKWNLFYFHFSFFLSSFISGLVNGCWQSFHTAGSVTKLLLVLRLVHSDIVKCFQVTQLCMFLPCRGERKKTNSGV